MKDIEYNVSKILDKKIKISVEVFPPKNDIVKQSLDQALEFLSKYKLQYISVTHGAGGGLSSSEDTINTIKKCKEATNIDVAGHIAGVRLTKDDLFIMLENYQKLGVNKVVALRGDHSEGLANSYYKSAYDMVKDILEFNNNFNISVAGYPDVHEQAKDLDEDVYYLKQKCDLGVNNIITQYFFNLDNFFKFIHKVQEYNINTKIIPGLLVINNFEQMIKFSKQCRVDIPQWMLDIFNKTDSKNSSDFITRLILLEQIRILNDNGFDEFHLYCLNRHENIAPILDMLVDKV